MALIGLLCLHHVGPTAGRRARKGRGGAAAGKAGLTTLRSFPHALSDEQCEALIATATRDARRPEGATTFGNDQSRDSDIRWLHRDHPSVAAVHRSMAQHTAKANEAWGWPLTRPEMQGLQFARYVEPHGGYDWHTDAVPQRDKRAAGGPTGPQMVSRMVTLVAQLSDPDSYTGGDLQVGAVNGVN